MLCKTEEHIQTYSVGLDASIASFGAYCMPVYHDEWYGFSVGTDNKHGSDTRRVLDIADDIVQSIAALDHVSIAVFEDYGPINRASGKIAQRAEICGIVKHYLLRTVRCPVIMVSPKGLKQYATGNGNASKDMMMDAAAQFDYYPQTNDEADAFFLAKIGVSLLAGLRVNVAHERVNP